MRFVVILILLMSSLIQAAYGLPGTSMGTEKEHSSLSTLILAQAAAPAGMESASHSPSNVESPVQRKSELRSILSQREFRDAQMSLMDRFVDRIKKALYRWFNRHDFQGVGNVLDAFTAVVVIVAIILLICLIAFALTFIGRRAMRGRTSLQENDIYAGPRTPKGALDESARLAAEGDFRSALRLAYLATLLRLDDKEIIRFDRTGTNWEYLYMLRNRSRLYAMLRPVTVTFDCKWYGHEPATETDYQAFVTAYRTVDSFGDDK
jgi:hypothetical protein